MEVSGRINGCIMEVSWKLWSLGTMLDEYPVSSYLTWHSQKTNATGEGDWSLLYWYDHEISWNITNHGISINVLVWNILGDWESPLVNEFLRWFPLATSRHHGLSIGPGTSVASAISVRPATRPSHPEMGTLWDYIRLYDIYTYIHIIYIIHIHIIYIYIHI